MTVQRGRPKNAMTKRRVQVLECIVERARAGERVTWAHIARTTGLHSYNDARRVAHDLKRMGRLNPLVPLPS